MSTEDFDMIKAEVEYHDAIAPEYDILYADKAHYRALSREIANDVSSTLARLTAPFSIIDIGCGTGSILEYLKKITDSVIGFDISRSMLRATRKKTGVAVICGDCFNLPFSQETFDIIILSGILHHLPSLNCLQEVKRVLKPNGTLLIYEPHQYQFLLAFVVRIIRRFLPSTYPSGHPAHSAHESPVNAATLLEALQTLGLKPVITTTTFFLPGAFGFSEEFHNRLNKILSSLWFFKRMGAVLHIKAVK